jgi:hypothetical protein
MDHLFVIDNRDPRAPSRIKCGVGTHACLGERLDGIRIALNRQNHPGIMKLPRSKLAIRNSETGVRDGRGGLCERKGRSQEYCDSCEEQLMSG